MTFEAKIVLIFFKVLATPVPLYIDLIPFS